MGALVDVTGSFFPAADVDTFEFAGRAGVTEDLSSRGLKLRTTEELAIGTRVRVQLWRGSVPIEVTGVVVRQCPPAQASLFDRRCAVHLDQPLA